MDNTGWLFVLTASGFVVFVLWLALSRYGNIPLGRDDEEPEFRDGVLGRDDVQRRHGHRADVLRRRRAADPLRRPAAGHRRRGQPRGRAERDGHHAVPLDPAPVGDLRRRRAWRSLRRVPQGPAAADQRGVRAAARAHAHTVRGARSSTCWRSSPRCSARPPRSGLGALQIRSGLQIVGGHRRNRQHRSWSSSSPCSPSRSCCPRCPGIARGIQWLSNINMVLAVVLALFVFVVGPTVFILNLMPTAVGSYLQRPRDDVGAHRRRGRRRQHLAAVVDDLLLGVVGVVDAVRRHVHRPDLARAHHPAVRRRRAAGAEPGLAGVVRRLRRRRDQRRNRAASTSPARAASRRSCSDCSTSTRSRPSRACW